ncbi:RNA polymerase sigma factor [Oscillospiraceae bacterium LTW-04]|nr:sigma-70 family RNA polymerase sigma factor [Oscillospiraceae bacterium MB24-C1]
MVIIFLGALSHSEKELVNQIFKDSNVKFYNISFQMLRSHSDAEEAVSEAFLKIMDHIEKIIGLPGPKIIPYCVVIVKNESANILRKRIKAVPLEELEAYDGSDYSEIENMWEQNIDREQLIFAIEELSDEEKYLVYLRYANDMNFKEIAALLGVSEETAKKRSYRILKKLRIFYKAGDKNVQHV